ncbi:MAG: LacI family DNA-binding transcriptional regulator [Saprospiraceae bacterium]|nr:LacI family DNA-binding transcriptional regulator [Saprospiraceae bacterium]
MKEKVNITIHDLAKELDLSPSTISRALKDHPSIGAQTRANVQKLAKLRGYRPNIMAVNLRNQQSKTIGVLISWINRPFFSNLISGIEEAAREKGYNVIISQTTDDLKIEKDNAKTLYDIRICGLITSISIETLEYPHFGQFYRSNTPVIFVDRVPGDFQGQKVVIDNYQAGYDATTHLIEQGCTRLAHLGGSLKQGLYKERLRGFRQALEDHNLVLNPNYILNGKSLSREESLVLATKLFEDGQGPDGIFGANDMAGVCAILVAKKYGKTVPDDVAVIGFNDDPICEIVDPPLSSMYHPAREMGRICVKRILDSLNKNNQSDDLSILTTELVPRKSTLRIVEIES